MKKYITLILLSFVILFVGGNISATQVLIDNNIKHVSILKENKKSNAPLLDEITFQKKGDGNLIINKKANNRDEYKIRYDKFNSRLTLYNLTPNSNISIINLLGQVYNEKTVYHASIDFSTKNWERGYYLIEVTNKGKDKVNKVYID